ncbi:hypothetical protein B0H17DRAFT_1213740 [Mycena rosella]|uniref:Uncharacterized protein n=1 Tax=Mycena rosella TaxID=1033263 RepID=A0AAD7CQA2_MYCRO|nr:hypothetical protein B0H17DRAFT_1213740 [Mycena rosella]
MSSPWRRLAPKRRTFLGELVIGLSIPFAQIPLRVSASINARSILTLTSGKATTTISRTSPPTPLIYGGPNIIGLISATYCSPSPLLSNFHQYSLVIYILRVYAPPRPPTQFSPPPPRATSLEPLFTILPSSSGPSRSALLARHAPGIKSDGAGRDGAMARRCTHTRSLRAARLRSKFSQACPPVKCCPYLLSPSALADTSTDCDSKERETILPKRSSGAAPPDYRTTLSLVAAS